MRKGRRPRLLAALITTAATLAAATGMATVPTATARADTTLTVVGTPPPGEPGEVIPAVPQPVFPGDFSGQIDTWQLANGQSASCPAPSGPGVAQCMAISDTGASSGYGPAQLQSAYALAASSAGGGVVPSTGDAEAVAVVAAYDDPNAASDLAVYRARYGLPACDTTTDEGCLTKVNETNQFSPLPAPPPASAGDWTWEESTDLDMITAICSNCRILLVEANSDSAADLGQADLAARNVADFVDNGWGSPEFDGEAADDGLYFDHPGTAEVFAAGNSGYGATWPASSQFVTSVGGTTLTEDSTAARGYDETAWAAGSSGCATAEPKPAWQKADDTSPNGCLNRTQNDVAADADPATGVAVYDSTAYTGSSTSRAAAWGLAGGTSVAAAIITAIYALNGYPQSGTYPASYPYQSGNSADFYPVTSGSDGTCETNRAYLCTGVTGYNGPAGLGTPDGVGGLAFSGTGDVITVTDPGPQDYEVNSRAVSLPMSASDSSVNQTLTYKATGLPSGLTINSASGLISGSVGSTASTSAVTVTATDEVGSGSVTFYIYVIPSTAAAFHPELGAVKMHIGGDCLDDTGGSTANGTKIEVWGCDGDVASQSWSFRPDGGPGGAGTLSLSDDTGACLDIVAEGTADGSKMQLWSCTGGANQQWRIESDGELVNPISGRCLTDPGNSTVYGTQDEIYDCSGATGQQWTPTPGPVQSGAAGKCLDDTGGSTANGTKIEIYSCNGDHSSQDWVMEPDGTVRIQGTDNCLDVTGLSTLDGAPIQLWSCTGGTNQQWIIGAEGELVNLNSGKCLDDPSNSTTDGTQLVQEDCYHRPGEVWVVT
jgi:hypothetical protein